MWCGTELGVVLALSQRDLSFWSLASSAMLRRRIRCDCARARSTDFWRFSVRSSIGQNRGRLPYRRPLRRGGSDGVAMCGSHDFGGEGCFEFAVGGSSSINRMRLWAQRGRGSAPGQKPRQRRATLAACQRKVRAHVCSIQPTISDGWTAPGDRKRRKSRMLMVSNCVTPCTYMLAARRA